MSETGIRWWHHLNRTQARDLVEEDPVAILPVAAVEQHGPHLPLSTDADIGHGLLEVAFRELEGAVYALPMVRIGTSEEHGDVPGTLSLPASTLEDVVTGIGASLARAGVRRLVLSNSHGGNRAALDSAALRLRREWSMLVVKANYFRFPRPDRLDLPEVEWEHGLHGGAVETAMMLHLRPDLVDENAIAVFGSLGQDLESSLERLRPEGQASFAWLADDLNPHGVVGDATLADAEMGERLLEHYGRILADVVRDTALFPLGRLVDPHP